VQEQCERSSDEIDRLVATSAALHSQLPINTTLAQQVCQAQAMPEDVPADTVLWLEKKRSASTSTVIVAPVVSVLVLSSLLLASALAVWHRRKLKRRQALRRQDPKHRSNVHLESDLQPPTSLVRPGTCWD
jgi:hypothetical protein